MGLIDVLISSDESDMAESSVNNGHSTTEEQRQSTLRIHLTRCEWVAV